LQNLTLMIRNQGGPGPPAFLHFILFKPSFQSASDRNPKPFCLFSGQQGGKSAELLKAWLLKENSLRLREKSFFPDKN